MTKQTKDKMGAFLDKYVISIHKLHAIMRNLDKPGKLEKVLEEHNLSQKDLKAILKSTSRKPQEGLTLDIPDKYVKIGYFSDPHIGHNRCREDGFELMSRVFEKEGVQFILCPGDHLEGMSGRPGHIYELDQLGFTAQANKAVELYDALGLPIFGIDGNHDGWYQDKGNAGIIVGEDLENRVKNYTHLGQDEGDLILKAKGKKPVVIKLFHGRDGTAYADSYKIQKLIESFTGGEKPNVVLSGHYHKSLFLARRNVFGFECGTLCGQSRFMRGKKLQAHQGFGIIDLYVGDEGVDRLKHEWIQLYEKNDVKKTTKRIKLQS